MSEFGTGYRVGVNAARGRQVSEEIWSALNQRRQQNQEQQQWQALQGQLQATQAQLHAAQLEITRLQQENGQVRQEHAELSRFSAWAMDHIEQKNQIIADQQSIMAVCLKD